MLSAVMFTSLAYIYIYSTSNTNMMSVQAVFVPPTQSAFLVNTVAGTEFEFEVSNSISAVALALSICNSTVNPVVFSLFNKTADSTDPVTLDPTTSPMNNCVTNFGELIMRYFGKGDVFEGTFYCPIDTSTYVPEDSSGGLTIATDDTLIRHGSDFIPLNTTDDTVLVQVQAQSRYYDDSTYDLEAELGEFQTRIHTQALHRGVFEQAIPQSVCTERHVHLNVEYRAARPQLQMLARGNSKSSLSSVSVSAEHEHSRDLGAIVLLAQGQRKHSSYGARDSVEELIQTLDLLYLNYNNRYHDDVWIFHEGDFTRELQHLVRAGRNEIRFFHLHGDNWEIYPSDLKEEYFAKVDRFSVGYKKMIRWYTIRIWEVLSTLGYTWVWRLDDDSKILSPIPYNIFAFMERNGYQYGYRQVAVEVPDYRFYHDFVQSYVISRNITNTRQLMDSCNAKESILNFTFSNCGKMPGYYNNFYVSNITRWLEADVQDLLRVIDDTGIIFQYRWNDLTHQSLAVRLLFDEATVHRFVGWGYSHFSGPPSKPLYGIVQSGYFDQNPYGTILNYAELSGVNKTQLLAGTRLLYGNSFTAGIRAAATAGGTFENASAICQHRFNDCLC